MGIAIFFVVLVGASFGSFFKLVIDRYAASEEFVFSRSKCLGCNALIKPIHNIPIVSYFLLKGRCSYCETLIPKSLLIYELFFAFLSILVVVNTETTFTALVPVLMFFYFLFFLAFFDLNYGVVPHQITYTLISLIVITSCVFNNDLTPLLSLGIIFVIFDLFVLVFSLFGNYKYDSSLIVYPLIIGSILFYFSQSLFISSFSVFLFYCALFVKLPLSRNRRPWFFYLAIFIFIVSQIMFSLPDLKSYFLLIGVIYFFCEVLAFFILNYSDLKFNIIEDESDKKEKLMFGGGDITVLALIGAFFGVNFAFSTLFYASIIALIVYFFNFLITKYLKFINLKYTNSIPFVPYLGISTLILFIIK